MKPHTLSVLVENKAGVLSRVTGLFSRRGFNIESLAVGTCEEPGMSRITIVVIGDDEKVEQVMKQLNKLIDIIKVTDHQDAHIVSFEQAKADIVSQLTDEKQTKFVEDYINSLKANAAGSLNTIWLAGRAASRAVMRIRGEDKIRGSQFTYRGRRVFPSYLQAGPSFGIEKSKQRMIAEDIGAAVKVAGL